MQNHDEKLTDMIRSVLPSTARRGVRATRRLIHSAERRTVKDRLRAGDDLVVVNTRGAISEMVWDRRAADKVAPLVRWALHHVRADPVLRDASTAERLDHFGRLLPDTTIGRPQPHRLAARMAGAPASPEAHQWRAPSIARTVRALYEAGYHGELNKRLKIRLLPTLSGIHDIDRFAEAAGQSTRAVVAAVATETGLVRRPHPKPRGVSTRR